jgi:hypothetical protein
MYIGQTGKYIEARCKEHMRHIRLDQLEKSAIAEHSINAGHQIDFNSFSVLDRASGYMDRLVKEAIQIRQPEQLQQGQWLHTELDLEPCNQVVVHT